MRAKAALLVHPASIFAFELLEIDGFDERRRPLHERKRRLALVLRGRKRVKPAGHHEHGLGLLAKAVGLELEGIVANPVHTINARFEEAATKVMWQQPLRSARCLIPAEGWYEWQKTRSVDTDTGEVKESKQPRSPPGKDAVLSCSILTRAVSPALEEVHDRMPVVLARCPTRRVARSGFVGRSEDPTITRSARGSTVRRTWTPILQFRARPAALGWIMSPLL